MRLPAFLTTRPSFLVGKQLPVLPRKRLAAILSPETLAAIRSHGQRLVTVLRNRERLAATLSPKRLAARLPSRQQLAARLPSRQQLAARLSPRQLATVLSRRHVSAVLNDQRFHIASTVALTALLIAVLLQSRTAS